MVASRPVRLMSRALFPLSLLLASPSFALAAQPVVNRGGETYSDVISASAENNDCGFDIFVEGEFRFVEQLFFDDAGNLVRAHSNVTDDWVEYGPGGSVNGHASASITTTDIFYGDGYESWVDTFRGVPIKWSAPGFGVIVRDAGNVSLARTLYYNGPGFEDDEFFQEITFEAGPHPTLQGSAQFNEDWIAEYCAILAG